MGFGGGGRQAATAPVPLPVIPPSAHPPVLASGMAKAKSIFDATNTKAGGGTIKTSPEGLITPPTTAKVTLLGQ